MNKSKLLSAVLALVLVLSTFTFGTISAGASDAVYYVDPINGDNANAGTESAPLKTLDAATAKMTGDTTVYLLSSIGLAHSGEAYLGNANGVLTIVGGRDGVVLASGISALDGTADKSGGNGLVLRGDVVFENIGFTTQFWSHLNTNGKSLTMGEGSYFDQTKYSTITETSGGAGGMLHVGAYYNGQPTKSEHFTINSPGNSFESPKFAAAYTTDGSGIKGNLYIDVIAGELKSIELQQANFNASHTGAVITGDVRVKVGKEGKIGDINATKTGNGQAYVDGYLHVIAENGASTGQFKLANFRNHSDEFYYVWIENPELGTLDNGEKTGEFIVKPAEGYMAIFTNEAGDNFYYGAGSAILPVDSYTVEFVEDRLISDNTADITIISAIPGESVWPVSIDNEEVDIEAVVTPAHTIVEYSKQYTYAITLTPKGGKAFSSDFTFTMNGSDDFDITAYSFTGDVISFKYVAAETAEDPTRCLVYYNGGVGVTGQGPDKFYKEVGDIIEIIDNPFNKGGYTFGGFTDGENTYQPGDEYEITGRVEFKPVWIAQPVYNVAFVDGGATGGFSPETISATEGETVVVPENTFSKYGYNFTYWTDGNGSKYFPGDKLVIGDSHVTLTANWETDAEAGTLIFVDTENGSGTNSGEDIDNALNTIDNAIEAAGGATATIVVKGEADLTTGVLEGATKLAIVGYDADAVLNVSGCVELPCDTVIKDIKINAENGAYIVSNGHSVVLGPNLQSVGKYHVSYVDGAVNASVDSLNTVINSGVTLDTYYIGGADLDSNTKGVNGPISITINGGEIGKLNLASKGATPASIDDGITYVITVNGGTIESVTADNYKKNDVRMHVVFNNGAYTPISSDVMSILEDNFTNVYVIDSGIGGNAEVTQVRRVRLSTDLSTYYYGKETATSLTKKTSAANVTLSNGVLRVRYGTFIDKNVTVELTAGEISGGALASSVELTADNANVTPSFENWSPELVDGKIGYKSTYDVDVVLEAADGYFFDSTSVPTVKVNGVEADVTFNADGTIAAAYTYDEPTGRAPMIPVKFSIGDGTAFSGELPADTEYEHLSTNRLPAAGVLNPGYKFNGWLCSADSKLYQANTDYEMTAEEEVTFTAQWLKRGSKELPFPTILIMYDLSEYARDRGRNPKFESEYIQIENAFANLEYAIGGTKTTKKVTFDYEEVAMVKSDKSKNPIMINNWEINKAKVDVTQYPFLTIVYYYDGTTAVGKKGISSFGNATLPDETVSDWYGVSVTSEQEVVGRKWAAVTFSYEGVAEEKGIPAGSYYRHFQIQPIGDQKCKSLGDETLYLKAMFFSKERPITE